MPKLVDHEARRHKVATAVMEIVSSGGLEAVTVRAVAARTGMSTTTVTHYFVDKDDLMRLVFRLVIERVRARVADAPAGERARALLLQALPLDAERRAEVRVWFSLLGLALARPALAALQRGAYAAWRRELAGALDDEGVRGEIDTMEAAGELIALVDGLSVQAAFDPHALPARRMVALVDEHLGAVRAIG